MKTFLFSLVMVLTLVANPSQLNAASPESQTTSDASMAQSYVANGVTLRMIAVAGGTFTMGATAEQGSVAQSNEKPAHQVTLSDYCIGETEVTQALWLAVMGDNPSFYTSANGYSDNLNRPVERVSWNDCQTFITKLNELTGQKFRLPTEAEWEYAARGGNKSKGCQFSGSNDISEVAWYWNDIPSRSKGKEGYGTQPVGTKAPNELGIFDMTGNVWEWCHDKYGYYSSRAQKNPSGASSGPYRVYRGGCWDNDPAGCRVAYRYGGKPNEKEDFIGLRLAL